MCHFFKVLELLFDGKKNMTVNFFMGKYIIVIVLINFYNPFLIPHDYYYPFKWFPPSHVTCKPWEKFDIYQGI